MGGLRNRLRMPLPDDAVYFLGAGATRADFPDAPLGDDLIHRILQDERRDPLLVELLETVFEEAALQREAEPAVRPRLDDIFTLLDAPLQGRARAPQRTRPRQFQDYYLPDGGYLPDHTPHRRTVRWPHETLKKIRDRLVLAIARVLRSDLPDGTGELARQFCDALPRERRVAIISTNYDLVMDNALFLRRNVHYGVPIRAAVHRFGNRPDAARADPETTHFFQFLPDDVNSGVHRLLKLHGSLNWLYCPRCAELDVTVGQKALAEILEDPAIGRCAMSRCTARYEAVLVGPSLEQRYEHRILRETWSLAERYLRDAGLLLIIGYSLPEADYLIRNLLARAFSWRSEKVTVVDRMDAESDDSKRRYDDLVRRYRRLFPSCNFRRDGLLGLLRDGGIFQTSEASADSDPPR